MPLHTIVVNQGGGGASGGLRACVRRGCRCTPSSSTRWERGGEALGLPAAEGGVSLHTIVINQVGGGEALGLPVGGGDSVAHHCHQPGGRRGGTGPTCGRRGRRCTPLSSTRWEGGRHWAYLWEEGASVHTIACVLVLSNLHFNNSLSWVHCWPGMAHHFTEDRDVNSIVSCTS